MQIAAIGESYFPALDDPNLVVPSPCKIVSDDGDNYWNYDEKIILLENQVNLCAGPCVVKIIVFYETIEVEISKRELQIG